MSHSGCLRPWRNSMLDLTFWTRRLTAGRAAGGRTSASERPFSGGYPAQAHRSHRHAIPDSPSGARECLAS